MTMDVHKTGRTADALELFSERNEKDYGLQITINLETPTKPQGFQFNLNLDLKKQNATHVHLR